MKKILLSVVCLIVVGVQSVMAQGLTATLQQNGRMVPYYGVDAFKNAYAAASDGAVITLSAGTFNPVDSITKPITVIGNGYRGDKKTTLNYIAKGGISSVSNFYSLIINANNVRIEGLSLGSDYKPIIIRKVSNLKISHCFIYNLSADHTHTNTIVDQCYIYEEYAIHKGNNYCIKNSNIQYFRRLNTADNLAYITNCYIPCYYYWYIASSTSSLNLISTSRPYAVYKNCILGYCNYSYSMVNSTSTDYYNGFYLIAPDRTESEYYNNVFFLYPYDNGGKLVEEVKNTKLIGTPEGPNRKNNMISTYDALIDTSKYWHEKGYFKTDLVGDDGKQVGMFGGTGFSTNPSIPRIIESTIDSYTDASGKINVKIKVESNQ